MLGDAGDVELVHAGRDREQDLQVGVLVEVVGERSGADVAHTVSLSPDRPDAERQIGQLLGEHALPNGAADGLRLVEERHPKGRCRFLSGAGTVQRSVDGRLPIAAALFSVSRT